MARTVATLIPSALLLTFALGGCSAPSATTGPVSPEDLAEQVTTVLAETAGRAPELVECPDPLDGKVGAEARCTLTDRSATYGVSVTVTDVADDEVILDVQVDPEPLTVEGDPT